MKADNFRTLFDYNYWANHRLWTCITPLSEEVYTRKTAFGAGSIQAEILYTMSVEWAWLSRLRGTSPHKLFSAEDLPTRTAIRKKWDEIEADVKAHVQALKDTDLEQVIHYESVAGAAFSNTAWEMLMHMVIHGTEHREKTTAMLYHFNQPTVSQDFITFVRQSRGQI